jgi:hypothetical protein
MVGRKDEGAGPPGVDISRCLERSEYKCRLVGMWGERGGGKGEKILV